MCSIQWLCHGMGNDFQLTGSFWGLLSFYASLNKVLDKHSTYLWIWKPWRPDDVNIMLRNLYKSYMTTFFLISTSIRMVIESDKTTSTTLSKETSRVLKIKLYLRRENRVNKNKILSFCVTLRIKYICKYVIKATYGNQVINRRHQTPQGQSVVKLEHPL